MRMSERMTSGRRPAAIVLLIISFGTAIPAVADDTADVHRGAQYLAPFKKDLVTALKAGLAEGPAAAIDACRIEAPAIAERHSQAGVRIGRSSGMLSDHYNPMTRTLAPASAARCALRLASAGRGSSGSSIWKVSGTVLILLTQRV